MMRLLLAPAVVEAMLPFRYNESSVCEMGVCEKPDMQYERIMNSQAGYQWNDAGGYCGSWAIGRAALAKGAFIDQQMVRDHTSPAPGCPSSHNSEILTPNIEEAFRRLKLKVEGFDFKNLPTPHQDAFFSFLKKQLVAGNPVTWFIMWSGQTYPIYDLELPHGVYGHVEPVIGIQSNHPLTDETVYDDDVLVHFDDNSKTTIYKPFSTLSGDWAGPGHASECHSGSSYCIGPYAYGWAVQGFLDDREAMPASLSIDPWQREPNVASKLFPAKPTDIKGTLTVEGLTAGTVYDIYRWDSAEDAFIYSEESKISSFTAPSDTFVFEDPKTFSSYSATYYRCVESSAPTVV
jgi:hypothetical protein